MNLARINDGMVIGYVCIIRLSTACLHMGPIDHALDAPVLPVFRTQLASPKPYPAITEKQNPAKLGPDKFCEVGVQHSGVEAPFFLGRAGIRQR